MPAAAVENPCPLYTLINSVDFHPQKNLFCATFTHGHRVVLYRLDPEGNAEAVQTLDNPAALLSDPQHAAFSPDGEKIAVANWTNRTFSIYRRANGDLFSKTPDTIFPFPHPLQSHRPHGIAFSPCGNYLAAAFGAASYHGRAIALFRIADGCALTDVLENPPGIPKGIAFSPDGMSLLVTFSDTNSLSIFDLAGKERIVPVPRQTIGSIEAGMSRPEDVKISSDGRYCAVSNSDEDTITFYSFDPTSNRIESATPLYTFRSPALKFPHGLAFSPDGTFFLATQFGPVSSTPEGDILWERQTTRARLAKIHIFRIHR